MKFKDKVDIITDFLYSTELVDIAHIQEALEDGEDAYSLLASTAVKSTPVKDFDEEIEHSPSEIIDTYEYAFSQFFLSLFNSGYRRYFVTQQDKECGCYRKITITVE